MAEETNEQQPHDEPFRRSRYRRYRRPNRKPHESAPAEGVSPADSSAASVSMSEVPAAGSAQQDNRPPQQSNQHRPQSNVEVSVVIPLYNEELSLKELADQLKNTLVRMGGRYELIFVDDGSTDNSFRVLRDLHFRNNRIKVIRFRRNYGKSAALMVGFQRAVGEFVITMDADLQDDPAEIPNLIRQIKSGYDVVSGWKKKRHDPITKTIPSKFFNFVTSLMTGVKIHDSNCGLKAYRRDVVKSVNVYGELHRYIPALAHWQGFRVGEAVVQHRARKYGKTKFGMGRFFRGFLDLLTVLFTTRYISRPLHLFGVWGIVSAFVGLCVDGYLVAEWIAGRTSLSNRPLFLVGLILVIVGIQFVSIGLLGEMITKGQHVEKEYSIREIIK
ncbi:MAG TPA: glycosyltransferase family 2 protein [Bacteroidota bacterium]|nr:glycosyltransferase family 2 protein [Bacteroidota bacterium]